MRRIAENVPDKKSFDDCFKALRDVESAVMVSDDPRGSFYVFPSQLTTEQQEIYNAVGLTSRQAPLRVLTKSTFAITQKMLCGRIRVTI